MVDVTRIDEEAHQRFNERARRFGLWVFALEVLGIGVLLINIPVGITLALVKCLGLVLWGYHLMSVSPWGGQMGDYEDVEKIAS